LSESEKILKTQQLLKLERDPDSGTLKGTSMGMDVIGYSKLHADTKRMRIVHATEGDLVRITVMGKGTIREHRK
jgi:hypothetical protein